MPTTEPPKTSWLGEFASFLRHHKLWWLLPIVLVLAGFVALAILAGTGAAPFIYSAG